MRASRIILLVGLPLLAVALVVVATAGGERAGVARAAPTVPTDEIDRAPTRLAVDDPTARADEVDESADGEARRVAAEPEPALPVARDAGTYQSGAVFGRVIDEHGVDVAGASVRLFDRTDERDREGRPGWELLEEEPSDPGGRFRFEGHRPLDSFWLQVDADGLVPRLTEIVAGQDTTVVLDFAVAIRGRVLGPDGEGVPDVRISVDRRVWDGEHMAQRLATTSMAGGSYELGPLRSDGTLRVRLERDAHLPVERTFQVREGRVDGYDLTVPAGDVFTIEVVGLESEEPVPGATLHVESRGEDATLGTSPTGIFELRGLDVDDPSIALVAHAPGHIRTRGSFSRKSLAEGVTIPVVPGGTVRGRVVDAAGAPIEGARVTVSHSHGRKRHIESAKRFRFSTGDGGIAIVSGEDGSFVIEDVPVGSQHMRVRASKEGYHYAYGEFFLLKSADGEATTEVTLRRAASLSGIVRINGEPGRARVHYKQVNDALQTERWGRGLEQGSTESDDGGAYRIDGLVEGKLELAVTLGPEKLPKGVSIEFDQQATLGADGDNRFDLDLEIPLAKIAGKVVGIDGSPVGGLSLLARSEGDFKDRYEARTRTDATGAFELFVPAPRGVTYRLSGGRGAARLRVRDVVPGTDDLWLEMRELGPVGFHVTDSRTGQVLDNFALAWRLTGDTGGYKTYGSRLYPGTDGVHVAELPAGTLDLRVTDPRRSLAAWTMSGLRVEPEGAGRVDVSLEPGSTLRVTFVDERGRRKKPPGRLALIAPGQEPPPGGSIARDVLRDQAINSDRRGSARVYGLYPDTYRVHVRGAKLSFDPKEIDMTRPGSHRVTVRWATKKKSKKNKKAKPKGGAPKTR